MKTIFTAICLLALSVFILPAQTKKGAESPKTKAGDVLIRMETDSGVIKLRLYGETPLHRDNFVKMVEKHFYDSLLFHRVINSFMIQGGDPESKNAPSGTMLGNGDAGYTVPAEFNTKFYHKKGALAGARQGDEVNPTKASSGCQFYIVHGKVFTPADLDMYEQRMEQQAKNMIFNQIISKPENKPLLDKLIALQSQSKIDSLQLLTKQIEPQINEEYIKKPVPKFSQEQRKAYTTVGGAPHLDGGYTVFGEVTEGLDIVDKIAAVAIDGNARPLKNVRIKKVTIIR